jgi:hypothetical protein
MERFEAWEEEEGSTPSTSGRSSRPGGGAGGSSTARRGTRPSSSAALAFAVYCDDKENCDPSTGLLQRFARTAASPLTPGAAAAAARDAAAAAPPPAAGAFWRNEGLRDKEGGDLLRAKRARRRAAGAR